MRRKRIVGHLDMDAFFAAIEERDKPWLTGLPIAVGADPMGGKGRGVVSTANYKARKYGIHSAMPISKAWRLSEAAKKDGKASVVFVGGNFRSYGEASHRIMGILREYVSRIEEASIDEAYLDLSFAKSYSRAKIICKKIKAEIKNRENLTASIGIGPNKLIAKIASDMQKPDGLTVVGVDDEKSCADFAEKFLELLPVRKIPGIGPKSEALFSRRGIRTVSDLKKSSQEDLYELFGKWGIDIYDRIRGRDNSPIVEEYEIKSIGEQETFLEDTKDSNLIFERALYLCESVINRLKKSKFNKFRTMVITVRFDDFQTKTRSYTLREPESDSRVLNFEVLKLLTPFLDRRENPKHKLIRLIGIRVEKLS